MSDAAMTAQENQLREFLLASNFDAQSLNAFALLAEKIRIEWPISARIELTERWRKKPPSSDVIRLYSLLFHLSGDLYYLERVVHYCGMVSERADPEFLHYIYWCMQRQIFLGRAEPTKSSFGACDLFRHYERLLEIIETQWGAVPRAVPKHQALERPRICFVTNQFIGLRHQPSRDCADFAVRLQSSHGAETAIINCNLMPLKTTATFMPPFSATLETSYKGAQTLETENGAVLMVSFAEVNFAREKINRILRTVESFRPDVIVAFGGSNIVVDLFARARACPTLFLPTTVGPAHTFADIILGYDTRDWVADLPPIHRPPFAGRFRPFTFGFALPPITPENNPYSLPEGAPVFAVVGNRLDEEVSASFIALLEKLLDQVPHAVVAFAGGVEALPARLAASRHADRLMALGYVTDVRGLYRRCAAFLNPPRQGGGGGAAYALGEGLPVVTNRNGDVASVAGGEACADDDAAFIARAAALALDLEYRRVEGKKASARYAEAIDRARAAERLMAYCHELIGV